MGTGLMPGHAGHRLQPVLLINQDYTWLPVLSFLLSHGGEGADDYLVTWHDLPRGGSVDGDYSAAALGV